MDQRAAIILCGGRSQRMGRPKALLPWGGSTLVQHTAAVAAEVVDELVLVSSTRLDPPAIPGARIVRDRAPDLGPLAGLREGLEAIDAPLAFVTSTDAPHLDAPFVRALFGPGRTAAPVVAGRVQPLLAVYEGRLATSAGTLLESGRRRPLDLLEAADYTALSPRELPPTRAFENINRPEDYLEAVVRERAAGAPWAVRSARVQFFGVARKRAGLDEVAVEPGALRDVLAAAARGRDELRLDPPDAQTSEYLYSLDGRAFLREGDVPVGPGECVVVLDAAVGG